MASNQFLNLYTTARKEGYRDGIEDRIPLFEIDEGKVAYRAKTRARWEATKPASSFENVSRKDVEAVDSWIAGYLRGYDEGEERKGSYMYSDSEPKATAEDIVRYAAYLKKTRLDDDDLAKLQEIIRVKRARR